MSLQALQERLTALQNATKQVEELIHRLANIKFQPGSVPLDYKDDDVSAELSNEIHQTLKEQAEDLELLDQEVQDLPSGRPGSDRDIDKAEISSRVTRAGQELKLYAQTCSTLFYEILTEI
jgi:protein transport protein SEC20